MVIVDRPPLVFSRHQRIYFSTLCYYLLDFQPVNLYPASEAGFCDVFGNVWEWIEDHFNGLGDFKAHLLYDDFSTPCFDGRHNMIMVCDLLNVIRLAQSHRTETIRSTNQNAKETHVTDAMRGKTCASEWRLVLVLHVLPIG